MKNSIGLQGIDFVEFSSPDPKQLEELFFAFGFSKKKINRNTNIELFEQGDIRFLLNRQNTGAAYKFHRLHGPSISSMGWKFIDPFKAYEAALARGGQAAQGELKYLDETPVPAIYGIGESLIYFLPMTTSDYEALGFVEHPQKQIQEGKGFTLIDHLTNNVEKGSMEKWSRFYKDIFEFTEVRYFDIRGAQTGLTSYALRSPCGTFCIPINEGSEKKSQINEYLEDYKGPGIQHLAFLTNDILTSLQSLSSGGIQTLDIDGDYYADIFQKFPQVKEDHQLIRKHQILVDGDEKGYLLQIFTKNLIGPIFIEIIQRNNHNSFGEGNFGALFRSIERDQIKRGYLPI